MNKFNFYYPIQVRYSDLDAQWHVNNARFLSFLEQTRFAYMKELDLFDSNNFLELPVIVANMNIDYHAPITLDQKIQVGLKISRIGTKSMQYDYVIEDSETGEIAAKATSIMVTYDYHNRKSIPVPEEWRTKIAEFEGLEK